MKKEIQQKKQNVLILLASVGAMLLASCTKEVKYEDAAVETKRTVISKDLIDQKSEFIYSSQQQNGSRSAADAFPFSSGENKRVKLQILEKNLRIVETERDQRFAGNSTNDKLVLEIPIEHVQFQCAKDKYGECTNKEEEASNVGWEQRNAIRIKLADVKSGELEILPILSNKSEGDDCYENVSSRLVSSDITTDAINFQIERVFKTKLACMQDGTLSDASISAIYHYSLVKASSVLSKDYKTVSYPQGSSDEQTFGFFATARNVLDVDNNNTTKSTIQVMNRWNPNRKEIVYYLSDEFNKPENRLVKQLTQQTFANLNLGLAQAGVNFRMKLKDPEGKVPGDIRNSMIVLVEDPVASSVIGYGPQTEDPVTGEIISARTVMFLGTIKKYVKYTYDEIVRTKRSEKSLPKISLAPSLAAKVASMKSTGHVFGSKVLVDKIQNRIAIGKTSKSKSTETKAADKIGMANKLAKLGSSLKKYTGVKNQEYSGNDAKTRLRYLQEAKNCAYVPLLEGASGGITTKLQNQFSADAKPWEQLTDSEKEAAIAIILPEIWVPTLIHEMGHNLGLRHNFAASEDKVNYPTQEELQAMGSDHVIPFSSVMDYGNDLKTLPVLGKYDIAALRFGYLREVELSGDGSVAQVDETLEKTQKALTAEKKEIKDFAYCTDEHTGINAGCKRFDLGSTKTEIVQNMITDYEDAYTKRNLRDGRANMSLMDDLVYAARINSIFKELRIMMESVEKIKYKYGLADDAAEWESIDFLKDLKQASLLSGAFLANVLLVPDTTCAIALATAPTTVVAVQPLSSIDSDAISCFKINVPAKYVIIGQAGKMFNSKKDPESRNAYADQIDVRGIWLDKVLALRTLTARTIGILSMDENSDNFLNVTELRSGILESVKGLMTNNVVDQVVFTLADGTKASLEIPYDMGETQIIKKPMIIDVLERRGASSGTIAMYAEKMGVRASGITPLQEVIARTMADDSIDPNRVHPEDKSISSMFSVYRISSILNQGFLPGTTSVKIDDLIYGANVENSLARESIESLKLVGTLEKVPKEKVEEILKAKLAKTEVPKDATEEEKAVWDLSSENLEAYLNEVLKPTQFYKQLLQILPGA